MEKIFNQMRLKKFEDKNEWHKISSMSQDYNLFSSPTFFQGLTCPYDLFVIYDDKKPLLSTVVFKKTSLKKKYFLQDFNYNQGIYFLITNKKKQRETLSFLLDQITKKYNQLRFSLNYNIQDIRAFQWHKYPKNEFNFNIMYSSLISISKKKCIDDILADFRYSRRREKKLFDKSHYKIEISNDFKKFFELYNISYKKILGKFVIDTHFKIIQNSLKNNFSRLNFIVKNKKTFGGSIFFYDNERAYYAYSFVKKSQEKFSFTTPLIIDQISYFYKKNLSFIDMMGINSPGRGDYKESFGGNTHSFFQAIYERKN